jgi:hypothetical protein
MQVSMNPRRILARVILHEDVRSFPVSPRVVPQRLQRARCARGGRGAREEIFR